MSSTWNGSTLALLLLSKDCMGEESHAVFHGHLEVDGDHVYLRRFDGSRISLLPDWCRRIRAVTDFDMPSLVGGAHYVLTLAVGRQAGERVAKPLTPIGAKRLETLQ